MREQVCDVLSAERYANKLNLRQTPSRQEFVSRANELSPSNLAVDEVWDDELIDRPVRRGQLVEGAAEAWGAFTSNATREALAESPGLNSLLRHVEVKRQRALGFEAGVGKTQKLYLNRHRVAIAFLNCCAKTGDLRFLNAALKLCDWSEKKHRRMKPCACSAKWLHALAMQESMMGEMFG